jgi:hypothetical protein
MMWFYNQSDFETALNKKTAKNNKVCHPARKELLSIIPLRTPLLTPLSGFNFASLRFLF